MLPRITPLRATVVSGAAAALLMTGGIAAAATGALPGAAQDTAHDVLAKIGVTVPGPAEASGGHADQRGAVAEQPTDSTTVDETVDGATEVTESGDESADTQQASDSGQGAEVSELAKTTEATGVEKGAEISGFASDGKSQAGQHDATTEERSSTPATSKPAAAGQPEETGKPEAPGSGGLATADQHRR